MKGTGSGFIAWMTRLVVVLSVIVLTGGVSATVATADTFTGSGTYTYSGGAGGGTLSWTWTNSNFICNGPNIGSETKNITSLTATTFSWTDSDGGMTWTRPSGTAGNITGTWTANDPSAGNSYTLVFTGTAAAGTASVTANIFHCGINGPLGVTSFIPPSGKVGSQVIINGSNFSPLTTENTVLFNGIPAVVTAVRPSQLFVLVPPGATTGIISISNPGGNAASSTPFTVNSGAASATLTWGGVHHRIDSAGVEFDALDAGINSYVSTLAGMTLTVSGPNGFSYSFTDADISPNVNGQLAVYRKYPTSATALQPGVYTYTLNDGQGHVSHRVDRHVTVSGPVPRVDSTTIQLQRKADGSYRISWAPLNDTKTYYYRVRISRNDTASTQVYTSARRMVAYSMYNNGTSDIPDIPAGVLFNDSAYKVRVEAGDSSDNDLATNRSDSVWKVFSPQQSDFDANKLLTNFAAVYNRTDGTGTQTFDASMNVSDPTKVTSILLTGPSGFSQTINPTTNISIRTTDGTTPITDFYINLPTGTTMPAGLYTFTYQTALGGSQTAYATLTTPVTYPVVNSTTMRAQDLGTGNVRFSWANVNHSGALYYRVVLTNAATPNVSYMTARQNQAYVDIPQSLITTLSPTRWRVEVYDSSDVTTQRNRFNTGFTTFSAVPVQAYNAAMPVINKLRIRNMVSSAGTAFSHISVDVTSSPGSLTQIIVTRPDATSFDLLATGRFSPVYNAYTFESAGTLAAGLYKVEAKNSAGTATRYMYVTAAHALPRPDYKTFHNDLEPNGDMRISWAPVVSDVPVWYQFSLFGRYDLNGDNLMEPVYTFNLNGTSNVQQASILIPAATLAGLTQAPKMAQVFAYDGSGFSVTSNVSQSVMVGAETPGFDYATLADVDGDGFASDVDPDDHDPTVYPFSSGGNPSLSVVISGNGQVNGTLACSSPLCSTQLAWNSPVALFATPSYGSVFANWSGACLGTDKDVCSFNLDADKTVTASFSKMNNVRAINQSGVVMADFDTLKSAYTDNAALADGYVLKLVRSSIFGFTETLAMDRAFQVKLSGGFDNIFTLNNGFYSKIRGPLMVKSGKLAVQNIVVTPP
ncbi:MAG: IPT/TIG domain-containing protein [Desulfuromonadales bacterium]|nr:IPT/TIG domain-containing protein [Desulfuromonadales bacterium]